MKSRHKGTLLFSLTLAAAVAVPLPALAANLEKIRAAKHEKFVRIVFDLDAAAKATVLTQGGALTLEIEGLQTSGKAKSYSNMGRVQGLEITAKGDTKAQVSFDLSGAVRPRIFTYTPDHYGGHRIVLDLWSVGAPTLEPATQEVAETKTPDEQVPVSVAVAESQHMAQPQPKPKPALTEEEPVKARVSTTPPSTGAPSSGERQTRKEPIRIEGMKVDEESDEAFGTIDHPVETEEDPQPAPQAQSETATNGPIKLHTLTVPEIAKPEAIKKPEVKAAAVKLEPISEVSDEAGLLKAGHVIDPLGQAQKQLDEGNAKEACTLIKDHYPAGSWNLPAMMLQGRCLLAMSKPSDAAGLYAEILSYDPDNQSARKALAGSQVEMGDLSSARDNYVRLLGSMGEGSERTKIEKHIADLEKRLKKNAY